MQNDAKDLILPSQRDEIVLALCRLAANGETPDALMRAREALVREVAALNTAVCS